MKTYLKSAFALACCIALQACVQPGLSTPSGKPEVTVRPPLARAQNAAIATMTADGFALVNQTSNSLVFERDLPPAQAALLLVGVGNSYHSQPKAVIRLTFVPAGGPIKIYGMVNAVTQGPFGQVKSLNMTGGKAAQELQATLETVKRRIGQG